MATTLAMEDSESNGYNISNFSVLIPNLEFLTARR